ncbi:ARL6 [Symbiodinium sp. KB8]|nr:ARL6 [Symbiodinium sp. KB8]
MGLLDMLMKAFGWRKEESSVLVVGLDNSGKTTILNFLKPAKNALLEVAPTVGFTVEQFEKGNIRFDAFDMSGQREYRSLWERYYKDAQSIIFVVDSADKVRMVVAKDELDALLSHEDVAERPVPLLIFANKTDKASALPLVEVISLLGLQDISGRAWKVQPSNALTGEGVDDGIEWLAQKVSEGASAGTGGSTAAAAAAAQ